MPFLTKSIVLDEKMILQAIVHNMLNILARMQWFD